MSRRRARVTVVLAVLAALLLACGVVTWRDTTRPTLRTIEVPVDGLDGQIRLLHVSDLQGERFGIGQERLADLLGGREYDVAVLTGDMVSEDGGDRTELVEALPIFERVSGSIVFVPGNHDDPRVGPMLAERLVVDLGAEDTYRTGTHASRNVLVFSTLSAAPRANETSADVLVVLDHMPPNDALAGELAGLGADLYLAGHFHGGQLRLPLLGALVVPWSHGAGWEVLPELRGIQVRGLREREGLWVHLSPGLGRQSLSGLELPRTFNRAEVTEIVLVPAE